MICMIFNHAGSVGSTKESSGRRIAGVKVDSHKGFQVDISHFGAIHLMYCKRVEDHLCPLKQLILVT